MPIIYYDTREHLEVILPLLTAFHDAGYQTQRTKLDVGDYMIPGGKISVDRKHSMQEVCSNLCMEHERFSRECQRAQDSGTHLIILIENTDNLLDMDDLLLWENPRRKYSPKAPDGWKLYRIMKTMTEKYGVNWKFCRPDETAAQIIKLLTASDGEKGKHHDEI